MADEATLEIKIADWSACPPQSVRVFIDGKCAATFLGCHLPQELRLEPGLHRVAVREFGCRSETLPVSLAPGERLTLECGYCEQASHRFYDRLLTAGMLGVTLLTPLTHFSLVAGCLLATAFIVLLDARVAPGAFLSLRGQNDPPVATAPRRRFLPPPPMTLRRWMIVVAGVSVMAALERHEWSSRRRARLEALAFSHRSRARSWERHEEFHRDFERISAIAESDDLAAIDSLTAKLSAAPGDPALTSALERRKRSLAYNRAQAARHAAQAAHAAQMRQKCLRAASNPGESVAPIPGPP